MRLRLCLPRLRRFEKNRDGSARQASIAARTTLIVQSQTLSVALIDEQPAPS